MLPGDDQVTFYMVKYPLTGGPFTGTKRHELMVRTMVLLIYKEIDYYTEPIESL